MRTSANQTRVRRLSNLIRNSLLGAVLLVASNSAQPALAETQVLPTPGKRIRIEGESFTATSQNAPIIETNNAKCSGGSNVGYFWNNMHIDFDLNVPRLLNYHISIHAASRLGTTIEVLLVDGSNETKLDTITIPKTANWRSYRSTVNQTITLPAGTQTLRFKNVGEGVNVDFIRFLAGAASDVKVNQPIANAGPDINPLKGFGSSWWRDGEDHASVGFQYIEWRRFEPEDDQFDGAYVEDVLDRHGSRNRHVIVQFVLDWDDWGASEPVGDSHYKGPQWLLDLVGENRGPADPTKPDSRITRATRYDDPLFIAEAVEAIDKLYKGTGVFKGFKNDPRTFVFQVGVLGHFGEWHTFPRNDWSPSDTTKMSILGTYLSNLGPDDFTQIRYPDEPVAVPMRGLGYTNGSATPTPHGIEFGEMINAGQLWMNGPIGGEWPPNVENNYWNDFFMTSNGKAFLERGGYSTMTPPEFKEMAAKFTGWTPNGLFMDMHRRMGYNFQTSGVRHIVARDKSGLTHVEVDLHNVGIAPFYKNWLVQLAILDAETGEAVDELDLDADVRELGPSESTTLSASSSALLDPAKNYRIGLRISQPRADEPKSTVWNIKPRHTYVELANDIDVIGGAWDANNALQGGWNILGDIQR